MLPHLIEGDLREALFTFSLPSILKYEATFGFYWLSEAYWVELIALIFFQVAFAGLTGLVVYKLVIQPKRYNTTFSRLLGFGIILPFWITCPVTLIRIFGVRNLIFKFMIGVVTPILSIFRATEAVYGFAPLSATKSAFDYTVYYGSVLVFSRDEQGHFIPNTKWKPLTHLVRFLAFLFVSGSLQSVLAPHENLALFGTTPGNGPEWFSLERLWTWQLYANSAFQAILFQMYLTTYCEGLTFVWSLSSGYQTDPIMNNPLFESKSPSDFWSRRWNLLIHRALKGGVFKPVYSITNSKTTAVVAAFLASGAFHEWLLNTLFAPLPDQLDDDGICSTCFTPTYGGAMIFFLWQAVIIAVEMVVGQTQFVTRLTKHLPVPVRTAMVIALGLPVAHFFCEPYVRSDFFTHGQAGFPMIMRVD